MEYSISEMCKLTGVSKDTLRYYDKINLITPKREASKYRTYNDKDVMLAKYIQVLKYIGYSLDEIREVLVLYYLPVGEDCTKRLKFFFPDNLKTSSSSVGSFTALKPKTCWCSSANFERKATVKPVSTAVQR